MEAKIHVDMKNAAHGDKKEHKGKHNRIKNKDNDKTNVVKGFHL